MVAVRHKPPKRAVLLATLAQRYAWTAGAELGVLDGRTFRYLLRTVPGLTLMGVDTWQPADVDLSLPGARDYADHDLEGYYEALCRSLSRYGGRGRLVRTTTAEAALSVGDASLDFVFIDADHTYGGVSSDIAAWRAKVRPGGMVLGHDYNPGRFPGVVQAVQEAFGEPILFGVDTVWGAQC